MGKFVVVRPRGRKRATSSEGENMPGKNEWYPSEKDIEDYQLWKQMLNAQAKEYNKLSQKKADGQLNLLKISVVNRVLEPLKELMSHEQTHGYLDTLSKDNMPTYSDVVLVISQYLTAFDEFNNRYYRKDKYTDRRRWMTSECPPDHNKNR
jgi:hypothetical protein